MCCRLTGVTREALQVGSARGSRRCSRRGDEHEPLGRSDVLGIAGD